MYIDTLAYQTREFFYSMGFGFILGMLYDLTGAFRLAVYNGKKKAALFDVVFAISAAFMSVIFVLGSCRGKFAFYVVFGISVGFVIYLFSLGCVFRRAAARIILAFKSFFDAVSKALGRFAKKITQTIVALTKKCSKNRKKSKNNLKKHLKEE
ncbi:MAG: spore cortex biosynthesis protein YabQ [Clostridia bacterium]|nr:spore cortex biosynthesis protein YabQ [Clostridia bacterium]